MHANLHLHARAEPVQHRNQAVHCEAAEVGIGGWPPRVPSFLKTLWAGAPSGLPLPGWVFSSRKPSAAPSPVPGPLPVYTLTRICYVEYTKKMESVFEIIAEPNRRAILGLLVSSQQSVGQIERQLRMPQPTVSKHLRVLREAGFVESTVDAQRRLYRLKPGPFQEVDAWLAQFRRFWSAHLDALERHLDRMIDDPATPTKRNTRKEKTTRPKPRT